jgi:hypothetical protein
VSEASALKRALARVSTWGRRLGATAEERAFGIAVLFCVLLGLWLRARGFFWAAPSFWIDECSWAIYLMEKPIGYLLIRPPGFMIVSKGLALLFGPYEAVLRTLPFCSGIAAVLFAPSLARRLFATHGARLLFVAVIALHPALVSFAKEFKPYEISATLHLALVLLTLRYVEPRSGRALGWLLGVAFFGGPFAQDLLFAYPGVFLVAGYDAFRHRRRHLVAIGGVAFAILVVLALQYVFIWSQLTTEDTDFWAKKYKIFYYPSAGTYPHWLYERYRGFAALPGLQKQYWNARWMAPQTLDHLKNAAIAVWGVLHLVGLVQMLVRRRFNQLALLTLPILVQFVFNVAGKWPFGPFRANLFLVGYSAGIAAMALDWPALGKRTWTAFAALLPTALFVLVPIFFLERGWGPTKRGMTYVSKVRVPIEWLAEQQKEQRLRHELLLVDRRSCDAWQYYVEYHPTVSRLQKTLKKGYDVRCIDKDSRLPDTMKEVVASGRPRIWILFNLRDRTQDALDSVRHSYKIAARTHVTGHLGAELVRAE